MRPSQIQDMVFLGQQSVIKTMSVTNAQVRSVLMNMASPTNAGQTMFDDIDEVLKQIGGINLMAWEYANTVSRNSPLVDDLGAQLGLTTVELDALFAQAAAISF